MTEGEHFCELASTKWIHRAAPASVMKILFSGGGTLGPVVPLLAIQEAVVTKHPDTTFVWVGTSFGPEKKIITELNILFLSIPAGKFRRYASVANFLDIFKVIAGFCKSFIILIREKPDMVVSAGGFVSVPLHWAAFVLSIPSWVHQQDVGVGLANKFMFRFATVVTTAFESTALQLKKFKARWIGNPCRNVVVPASDLPQWYNYFNIPTNAPVVLVMGGGTGAVTLNKIVFSVLPNIPYNWHIIHLLGVEKSITESEELKKTYKNYHAYEILGKEMLGAYAISSIVVARAGMGTLTELAALKKPAILFPKTETHQEDNARILGAGGGVLTLNEDTDDGAKLINLLQQLMDHKSAATGMASRLAKLLPAASKATLVSIVETLCHKT